MFHENRLLADDSHVKSYLIFFLKLEKMSQLLWSAAVVIGALRVNYNYVHCVDKNSVDLEQWLRQKSTCTCTS